MLKCNTNAFRFCTRGFLARGKMVLSVAAAMLATITTSSTQSLGAIEFEDVTEKLGLTLHLKGWGLGHGAAWGDLTGNDRPDLYIGAFASHGMYDGVDVPLPNMLFLNGEEGFELSPDELVRYDRRGRPRAERPRVGMALFVDLNNNGRRDILMGMILEDKQGRVQPVVVRNLGVNDDDLPANQSLTVPAGEGSPIPFEQMAAEGLTLYKRLSECSHAQ